MKTDQAILCVDDEAVIVFSLKQELKVRFGDRFIYETALNAEDALEIIGDLNEEGVKLILVISDWLMPGMKGDEFLRRVKASYPSVKTILITGQAEDSVISSLVREGITNSVVMKPWRTADLIRKIEQCIDGGNEPLLQPVP
jgi:CheY-like chemotaxis protein